VTIIATVVIPLLEIGPELATLSPGKLEHPSIDSSELPWRKHAAITRMVIIGRTGVAVDGAESDGWEPRKLDHGSAICSAHSRLLGKEQFLRIHEPFANSIKKRNLTWSSYPCPSQKEKKNCAARLTHAELPTRSRSHKSIE
jgi:hypothetical protein